MLVQGAQMTKTFRVENFHCGLKSLQVALKVSTVVRKVFRRPGKFPGGIESFQVAWKSFQVALKVSTVVWKVFRWPWKVSRWH